MLPLVIEARDNFWWRKVGGGQEDRGSCFRLRLIMQLQVTCSEQQFCRNIAARLSKIKKFRFREGRKTEIKKMKINSEEKAGGTTAQLPELGPGCQILHVSLHQRSFTNCCLLNGSSHQNFGVQHPLLPKKTVEDGKYCGKQFLIARRVKLTTHKTGTKK